MGQLYRDVVIAGEFRVGDRATNVPLDELVGEATPVNSAKAAATLDSAAANSDLTLTAVVGGEGGNDYSVKTVQGADALGVALDAETGLITVTLAAAGNTATEVKAAWDAAAAVVAVATCAVEGTGAGAVDVIAAQDFTGGVDGTVGEKGTQLFDDTNLYIAVQDNTAEDAVWRKIAHSAL